MDLTGLSPVISEGVCSATVTVKSSSRRPHVLIVDDDEMKRRELRMLLDLYGIRTLEAKCGDEAMDITVRARPDLVLLNTELAHRTGYETARLIRAIKAFDRMPIIFLSNTSDPLMKKKAFAVGGNGFHVAPLDLDRLDNILEIFLF